MGELWCRLCESNLIVPQQWLPSRMAKSKLHISAYTPLHSIIVIKNFFTGEEQYHALYYFPAAVKKQRITMLKNFLPRVVAAGVKKHFIICASNETTRQTLEVFTMDFPAPEIYVLGWENAVEILPLYLADEQVFYRELADRLKHKHTRVNFVPTGPLESGPYRFEDGGVNIYAAELVSGHLATFARLQHRGFARLPERLTPISQMQATITRSASCFPTLTGSVCNTTKAGEDIFKSAVRWNTCQQPSTGQTRSSLLYNSGLNAETLKTAFPGCTHLYNIK